VAQTAGPPLGVVLYSFNREYRSRKYTFEELVRKTGELGLGPGFEIVGFMAFRGYPRIGDDVALRFRRLLDEVGLEPSLLSGNVDIGRRRDRQLTDDEVLDLVNLQLEAAVKLGYTKLKIQFGANANVIRRLAPLAEKAGVQVGPEQHAPHSIDHPTVQAWLELFDELDTPYVGIVPDFGVAARKLHPGYAESQLADGIDPQAVQLVVDTWNRVHESQGGPLAPFEARRELLEKVAAIDERCVGFAWRAMTLFGHQDPEQWAPVMKHIIHVHAKFHHIGENGEDEAFDYDRILRVFRENGYTGGYSSEYEGHWWNKEPDAFAELAAQQAIMRRYLGSTAGDVAAGTPTAG
jgi:sugar phosphate isomerase/epimerase